jgi:geranylgeranyl reductase family protein
MAEAYDVIVVGAGPAGATAAYFLGQAGRRVLVLEKARVPRYKTCGGGLSCRVLEQFPFSFEPVVEARVKAVRYDLGSRSVAVPLPDRTLEMVMRDRFDAHLLAHAAAEVRTGASVQRVTEGDGSVCVETADGGAYSASHVIGSDGANSVVARSLGLWRGRRMAAAIEAEVPVPPQVMQRFAETVVFVFGQVRLGYLWIFPKARHLSVGIGALRPRRGELQGTLNRVMKRYGISLDGVPLHGHPIPYYTGREALSSRRSLLVGDAAGLVDPLTGEGIRFAVKSGRWAAEAILSGEIEGYTKRVRREIGLSHRVGMGLAALFYHLPWLCYLLGVRNPFASRAFAAMLGDEIDYPELLLYLFGSLPFYIGTELLAALAGWVRGPEQVRRIRRAVYDVPFDGPVRREGGARP